LPHALISICSANGKTQQENLSFFNQTRHDIVKIHKRIRKAIKYATADFPLEFSSYDFYRLVFSLSLSLAFYLRLRTPHLSPPHDLPL
jgi:hypothetical protein